jgi:hypothetical protein
MQPILIKFYYIKQRMEKVMEMKEDIHQLIINTGLSKVRCGRIIHQECNGNNKPIYSLNFTMYPNEVNCPECIEERNSYL